MFVLPLSRSTRRVVAPQFSRVADQFFDESLSRFFGGATSDVPARVPALDVSETDTAYSVAFDVPGVTREQLKVSVEGRRVSIETVEPAKVEASEPVAADAANLPAPAAPRVLYRERTTARYARTVSLPSEVDQAASHAKFDNGVLTLTLAKKVPTGATQISIS
jgi:HSP20 family protein